MSVGAKLLLHTLSLIVGFVVLGSCLLWQLFWRYALEEDRRDLERACQSYELHMDMRRRNLLDTALALSRSPEVLELHRSSPTPAATEAAVARLADRSNQPRLALADANGAVAAATSAMRPLLGASRVRTELRRASEGTPHETIWASGTQLCLVAIVPVDHQGTHGALALAELVDDHLADELRQVTGRDVMIVNEGRLIACSFEPRLPRPQRLSNSVWQPPDDKSSPPFACFQIEVDGDRRLAAAAPLRAALGRVVLSRSLTEISGGMSPSFWRLALFGLGGVVLGVLLCVLLARRIAAPLQRLERAARALAAGDLEAHVAVESKDEVGRLAKAFNQMAERVEALVADVSAKAAEAERANRAKDAFLASVTHELRTPLTSVRAYAELLLTYGQSSEEDQEFLEIIRAESERLTGLIDDVIDLVHLEAERFEWRLDHFDLRDLVNEARKVVADRLAYKKMGCVVTVPSEAVPYHGDPVRLRQILVRLMINAWKFTPEGSEIHVRLLLTPQRVELRVADQGPGLHGREKQAIFERFYQQGDGLTGKPAGAGLGLAITRQIVAAHGGSVYCTDAEGGGAEFVVDLPQLTTGLQRPIDVQSSRRQQLPVVAGLCPAPEVASATSRL